MKKPLGPGRPAFTMTELLVVLAILALLFSLLVPAVMKVVESAHRLECMNNLSQLGQAAYVYAQTYGRLPPACTMPYAQPGQKPSITDASGLPPVEMVNDSAARKDSDPNQPFGPNWAVYLLPMLGENGLYDAANVGDYMTGYQSGDAARRDHWRTVVQKVKVRAYLCPSDAGQDTPFDGYANAPGPWARGNYAANAGPGWWQTTYQGGHYQESYGETGPVMGINWGARLTEIPDGLSKTILFNEVRSGVNHLDARGVWAMGFPGSSVTAANAIGTTTTPNDSDDQSDDIEGCPSFWYAGMGTNDHMGCSKGIGNLGWPSWQAQARSRHLGGVNACFADGSVHWVSNYVYQSVWFSMLSSRDGNPYSFDD